MPYLTLIKVGLEFMWKYKTFFLYSLIILSLFGAYKYNQYQTNKIKTLKLSLEDSQALTREAIKKHNKVMEDYKTIQDELKVNEEKKRKLEINNKKLKDKLAEAMGGQNETWSNTTVPDAVRMLLEKGPH